MNTNQLQRMIQGHEPVPTLRELQNPQSLVSLAATTLNGLYPEIDRMVIMLACHDALRRLVNNEIEGRTKSFRQYLESEHGVIIP